jgi:hypothetical protein
MNWIASLARVIGAGIPFGGIVVQLSAEIESHRIQERLRKIEDPISSLHPDVHEVSELIYAQVSKTGDSKVKLSDEETERYSRVLAILEANHLIDGTHAIGERFVDGFWLQNPNYVLYMAALYEKADLMERLIAHIDSCASGTWIRGAELAAELKLPLRTVEAVLELYEQRGLGTLSKELGTVNYYCQA